MLNARSAKRVGLLAVLLFPCTANASGYEIMTCRPAISEMDLGGLRGGADVSGPLRCSTGLVENVRYPRGLTELYEAGWRIIQVVSGSHLDVLVFWLERAKGNIEK